MSFDRLIYIDRLKEAGVDEAMARAHADALREALFESVASKSDLKEEVASIRADLKDEARSIRADLKDNVTRLEHSIAILDRKIEITARDLTIRGAGGLVIIASIMIGLKLFG